jgi:hypothetical protein
VNIGLTGGVMEGRKFWKKKRKTIFSVNNGN